MIYIYSIIGENQLDKADILKRSLQKFGHELFLVPTYSMELKNLSKLVKINEKIQGTTYNDDDVIILLDAFDIHCCTNPSIIPEYLKQNGIDILLSVEDTFGLHPASTKEYFNGISTINKKSPRYLNSGAIIGFANKLKEFYSDMMSKYNEITALLKAQSIMNIRIATSDQSYMCIYMQMMDALKCTKYKIALDFDDKITLTNTNTNRPYNIKNHVFIHTWSLHMRRQKMKYDKITADLGL
jgi:hypothetical protein